MPHVQPNVTSFDKLKKWADILDDIFSACRSLIPPWVIELVSPLLVGSLFSIIGVGEGYQAKKELKEIRNREPSKRPLNPELKAAEEKLEILVRNYIQVVSVVIVGLSATLIAAGAASGLNATPLGNDNVTHWLNHNEKAADIEAYNFIIVVLVLSIYMARLLEKSQQLHHSRQLQNDPESSDIYKAFGFQLIEVCAYGLVCIGIGAATGVMTGLLAKKLTTASIGPLELDVTPGFILLIIGVVVGILSKNYLEPKYGPQARAHPNVPGQEEMPLLPQEPLIVVSSPTPPSGSNRAQTPPVNSSFSNNCQRFDELSRKPSDELEKLPHNPSFILLGEKGNDQGPSLNC
jgi:hypothetical protein